MQYIQTIFGRVQAFEKEDQDPNPEISSLMRRKSAFAFRHA